MTFPGARPVVQRRWAATIVLLCTVALLTGAFALARDPFAVSRAARGMALRARGASVLDSEGIILQRTASDCGPAAIANLFRVLGLDEPGLDTLSTLAGLRPEGTTLRGLMDAAAAFGLWLTPIRVRPPSTRELALPFVAWIERGHFVVVVEREDSGRLKVIDPQVGRLVMHERTFDRRWTGEALVLTSDLLRRRPDAQDARTAGTSEAAETRAGIDRETRDP